MRPVAAIRQILDALTVDGGILGDVDAVFADELPGHYSRNIPPDRVILLQDAGGAQTSQGARSYARIANTRIDVKCYAKDLSTAGNISERVNTFLLKLTRQTVTPPSRYLSLPTDADSIVVRTATVSGGPLPLKDPDTDWPHYYRSYEVSTSPMS